MSTRTIALITTLLVISHSLSNFTSATNANGKTVNIPDIPLDIKHGNKQLDFDSLFANDVAALPLFDNKMESNLDALIKDAGNDTQALGYIFQQAFNGDLMTVLKTNDNIALGNLKEIREFKPVELGKSGSGNANIGANTIKTK